MSDTEEKDKSEKPCEKKQDGMERWGKGRQAAVIDEHFNEILFRLYMSGKRYAELVALFEGTDKEFSMPQLRSAASRYQWAQRKKTVLEKVRQRVDQESEYFFYQKVDMVNKMLVISQIEMEKEYSAYIKDPKKNPRPEWLPKTVTDLQALFSLHSAVMGHGPMPGADGQAGPPPGINFNNFNFGNQAPAGIHPNAAGQILKILGDAATQDHFNAMDAGMTPIPLAKDVHEVEDEES